MMELPASWHLSILDVVAVYAIGLAWIGARNLIASGANRGVTNRRAGLVTASMIGLMLCVSSPLDRAGMEWLSWHMVAHVLEMFYLPVLFVLAAPSSLFSAAVPDLSRWMGKRITSPLGRTVAVVRSPVTAVLCFNLVMVGWHVPVIFNWASAHTFIHEVVMVPTFFFAGVVFWRLILAGPGLQPTATRRGQVVAVIVTAFVMIVLAMWMAIGAKTAWYSMYLDAHGEPAALRDQHIAAGVLWVCGDLWAIPAFVLIAQRLLKASGGVTNSVDRIFGRSREPLA